MDGRIYIICCVDRDLQKYLRKLRAYGTEKRIPNVTDEVAMFLNMMIRVKRPKNILEIGCANGYSTIWMAESAEKTGAKIHTIDHSAPTFEEAKKNLEEAGLSHVVEFHFGDAVEVISRMEPDLVFDFVFVDGEKASYLDFWKAVGPRLSMAAVVIFDDMMAFPGKTASFYDFIRSAEGVGQLLIPIDGDDGILMVVKQ